MNRPKDDNRKSEKHSRRQASAPGRIVSVAENSTGAIDFDHHGAAHWKWVTETDADAEDSADGTFDYLKALDNNGLTIVDDPSPPDEKGRSEPGGGYNPYDARPVKGKAKRRR